MRTIYSSEHILAYPHIDFENDLTSILTKNGFKVTDLSYHHNYKPQTMSHLRSDTSPVSLSVRLAPDMMISKDDETIFCELKTGRSKDIIRLEAYQFMCNRIREEYFCTPVLYLYRGVASDGKIIGCYASQIKENLLVIPDI